MAATLRTLILALAAPPLLLLFWAHSVRQFATGTDLAAMAVAGLVGLAGIATAPWREGVRMAAAAVYVAVGLIALPLLGLLAVCSTGDCL